jgi:hypothetical protein
MVLMLWSGLAHAQTVSIEAFSHDRANLRGAIGDELRARGIEVVPSGGDLIVRGEVRARRVRLTLTRGSEVTRRRISGSLAQQVARAADAIAALIDPRAPALVESPVVPEPRTEPARPIHPAPAPAPAAMSPPPSLEAPAAFEIEAGFALFSRRLSFRSDLFSRLADFEISPAARVSAGLRWFPLRHWSAEPWAHFGVGAAIESAVGLDATVRGQQQSYSTSSNAWRLDLRYVLRVDRHTFGIELGYGEELFASYAPPVSSTALPRSQLTSVTYRYLRVGLDARVRVHDLLSIGANGGYRPVLATGGFDRSHGFPPSDGGAFDLGISVGVRLAWFFEVRARAEYHRYFFSFHPAPGDYYVVGGVLDEWTSVGIDAVLLLPGVS